MLAFSVCPVGREVNMSAYAGKPQGTAAERHGICNCTWRRKVAFCSLVNKLKKKKKSVILLDKVYSDRMPYKMGTCKEEVMCR